MIPINHFVVVESTKEQRVLAGGFRDSDDETVRYIQATVFAASEKTLVNKGDIVYFDRHAGHETIYKGEEYTVIKETDIAIIERDGTKEPA